MGFLDKAKKLAEQAQTKLDETRKPPQEDDEAGARAEPAEQLEESRTPPHGDPLAD